MKKQFRIKMKIKSDISAFERKLFKLEPIPALYNDCMTN